MHRDINGYFGVRSSVCTGRTEIEMGFTDSKKEYVIEDMYPKRPWMNYLWNEEYVTCINQFGLGGSIMKAENGFQREIARDTDNRLIFIKENGKSYCINRNYGRLPFGEYKTAVGMGYSKIISEYNNIRTELLIFVPLHGKRECWQLTIENKSNCERKLDIYAFADVNSRIGWHAPCNKDTFEESVNGVCFQHVAYNSPTKYHCIHFASDSEIYGYDVAGKRFVGVYGSRSEPDALQAERLECRGNVFDNFTAGALQLKAELAPGGAKTIRFTLGVETGVAEAAKASKQILAEGAFEKELAAIKEKTSVYDSRVYIKTPDEHINRMVNIWLKRQMDLGKTWGRVYNLGFRDIMQDITGFVPLDDKASREKLLYCLQYQKPDGNTLRSWMPLDLDPYRDGAAWLLPAVVTYIKETGDLSVLDEPVGYWESDMRETVFEHCIRGADFLHRETGEWGLCLWGGGDWNDSFDGAGLNMIGESVWLSIAAVKATSDFIELLKYIGNEELADKYQSLNDKMIHNIRSRGWDRDHFIYGVNDWRERVGSYDTEDAQIFLNPQSWAVIAGIADDNDALLDLAENKLCCDFGYVQCVPSYSRPNPHVGRISYFGKGLFENGSVYNHGCAFKLVADCIAGRGENAYKTLKLMSPFNPKNPYTHSGVEPYVTTNMYLGPECELRAGEVTGSWTTGTTSWVFRGITEYMLGIRAEFDGLLAEPCLPPEWDGAEITRTYRGAVYNIKIKRTGEKAVYFDGRRIASKLLPKCEAGTVHDVEVMI